MSDLGDRIAESIAAFDPQVPDGTIVRFTLHREDLEEYAGKSFPGVAIWGGNAWNVAPGNPLIGGSATNHVAFMQALAKCNATDVELAVEWEALKG